MANFNIPMKLYIFEELIFADGDDRRTYRRMFMIV